MPRNGSGSYVLPYDWQDDDTNDIPIRSDRMQAQDQDIADALTASLTKDGQTTPTANIPMGGYRLTGLGAGTVATDAMQLQQAQSNSGKYVVVSGTDTYTATPSPAITAYADGQGFLCYFTNANTAASPTINFNSLGALNLVKGAATALVAGDIKAGSVAWVIVVGSNAHFIPTLSSPGPFGLSEGGTITAESYSAANGFFYDVACTTSARTVKLLSLSAGKMVGFQKYGTKTLTLNINGMKFNGSSTNPTTTGEGITILRMSPDSARGLQEM